VNKHWAEAAVGGLCAAFYLAKGIVPDVSLWFSVVFNVTGTSHYFLIEIFIYFIHHRI
jgi:hypothetical protein